MKEAPTLESIRALQKKKRQCLQTKRDSAMELEALREAFSKLKNAILSWGKYVPTILLKQLYEAGIEAGIGCSRLDVTILFCDIANFQELCEGKDADEVLTILGSVLEIIHSKVEEHSGTLLEFIGDEVLA